MKRYGLLIGSVGGAVAIHVALVACGGMSLGVGSEDGGIVADAGQWLADAARDVVGLETSDAVAQSQTDASGIVDVALVPPSDAGAQPRVLGVACDQVFHARHHYLAWTSITGWYADVAIPGMLTRDVPRVTIMLCDPVTPPRTTLDDHGASCPAGDDGCTRDGYVPPNPGPCVPAEPVVLDGRVSVYCGAQVTTDDTVPDQNGNQIPRHTVGPDTHYQHAYIRID